MRGQRVSTRRRPAPASARSRPSWAAPGRAEGRDRSRRSVRTTLAQSRARASTRSRATSAVCGSRAVTRKGLRRAGWVVGQARPLSKRHDDEMSRIARVRPAPRRTCCDGLDLATLPRMDCGRGSRNVLAECVVGYRNEDPIVRRAACRSDGARSHHQVVNTELARAEQRLLLDTGGLIVRIADARGGPAAGVRGPCESMNSKITLRKRSVPMFSVEWVKPADRKRTSPGVNESSTGAAPSNDARVRPPLTNTDSMSRSCRWSTVAWPGGMSSKKMVTRASP